jgi:hypothetical protein
MEETKPPLLKQLVSVKRKNWGIGEFDEIV